MSRSRVWLAVAIVLAAAVAVVVSTRLGGDDDVDPGAQTDLVVAATRVGGHPTTALPGIVGRRDGCVLLDDTVLVFPPGTTWADFPHELELPSGTLVEVGEESTIDGGLLRDSDDLESTIGSKAVAAVARCRSDADATTDQVALVAP